MVMFFCDNCGSKCRPWFTTNELVWYLTEEPKGIGLMPSIETLKIIHALSVKDRICIVTKAFKFVRQCFKFNCYICETFESVKMKII